MRKRVIIIITAFLICSLSTINLYSCKTSGNSNSSSISVAAKDIPVILYTVDTTKELKDVTTAIKIKYDITAKKLETEPVDIFSFKNGYYENYQWNKENELLFSAGSKIVSVSDNFVVKKDIPSQQLTKIYEIDGTIYKVYGDEQGIVLQEDSGGKNHNININLVNENKEYRDFTPMTLSKAGKDLIILVHYYHPIEDGGMASGLYQVRLSGKETKVDKIDLKGQCCINYEIEPVVIGDKIYVNTYGNIGYISIFKKSFNAVPYFNTLKGEAQSDLTLMQDIPDSFHSQPVIGKIGDLLLLSYGSKFTNYIWGIRNDKVVFKIKTSNNDILDDNGNKIGTAKWSIERVLLPNW